MSPYVTAFGGIAIGLWMGVAVCILMDTPTQPAPAPSAPPTTLEAWGTGYQQGFSDSREFCEQLLLRQQEMMLEHLEHPTPRHQDSVRGGADRDGATISGLRGTEVPPTEDGEGQQPGYTGNASDWHSGPIRIS